MMRPTHFIVLAVLAVFLKFAASNVIRDSTNPEKATTTLSSVAAVGLDYIRKYENVDEDLTAEKYQSPEGARKFIAAFQRAFKIDGSGEMNEDTIYWMSQSRCGIKDDFVKEALIEIEDEEAEEETEKDEGNTGIKDKKGKGGGRKQKKNRKGKNGRRKQKKNNKGKNGRRKQKKNHKGKNGRKNRKNRQRLRRSKRFNLQGSKYSKKDVPYSLPINPHPNLSEREVEEALDTAAQMWNGAADINLHKVSNPSRAKIVTEFVRREHGDGDAFDGQGGTLAHAYFPQFGGDLHWDVEEDFTVDSHQGTNFLQTTLHEFGHSVGLSHSNDKNSVMAPFLRPYDPNEKLKSDDIKGIQKLYGPPSESNNGGGGSNLPSPPKDDRKSYCDTLSKYITTPAIGVKYRITIGRKGCLCHWDGRKFKQIRCF